ncbi:MAG: hypothetical protein N2449_07260 [Bacteroidales bacterium]|nr:hypothetical protein [Bacteroidales bacterium]
MNEFHQQYELGSFRDPSSCIFKENHQIFRRIRPSYLETYYSLRNSNFFDILQKKHLLIEHTEVSTEPHNFIIKPITIPFISYPYEWSFSQLKDAALLTLKIQYEALLHNFTLKDASAFNVQFIGNKPIFIDTTSFEVYENGKPWVAYKQFCEHFLSPLLLSKYTHRSISHWWYFNLDGIPLNITHKLLSFRSYFNSLSLFHIHAHSYNINKPSQNITTKPTNYYISKEKLLKLIEHLYENISVLSIKNNSYWNNYYKTCTYDAETLNDKLQFLTTHISKNNTNFLLDLGCNNGYFANKLSSNNIYTIAIDNDEQVIDFFYKNLSTKTHILPLVVNIVNPTPALGWKNKERNSFLDRIGTKNITLALAIVHHLRIGHNIPLIEIAHFLASVSQQLFIEFVPKDDQQVKLLLQNKQDVYHDYYLEHFENIFQQYFHIHDKKKLSNSNRILYNMIRK